jgi:molybdopterin-guanine dinucleotide biosynthesis protein A
MGQSKALLPFGSETMLPRVVRILQSVVSPIVVVAAHDQDLPELPAEVRVIRDEYEALGPLAGLAAGLGSLAGIVEAAYVSSCDVPLLRPQFVRRIVDLLEDSDLVIPREGRFHHPLAAAYRVALEPVVRELVESRRLRPVYLLERVRFREVDVSELRDVDPELESLRNLNTPEDYAAALRAVGIGPKAQGGE